jgi:hypothetical protein
MKNFIYSRLLGLDLKALDLSSAKTKRNYLNLGYCLIFVALLSIASGVKIMSLFTSNQLLLALGGMITFGIVFFMDYLLVSSSTNLLGGFTRFLFGVLNSAVSATCLLLLINYTDIEDYKESISKNQMTTLKNDYVTGYKDRYKVYNEQVNDNENYRKTIVEPEALNGYAGTVYGMKKAPYLLRKAELEKMKKGLDSVENSSFRKEYQDELNKLKKEEKMGLFEQIDIMFSKVIPRSTSSIVFGFIIVFLLLILELSVLIFKQSISKENDYDRWVIELDKVKSVKNTEEINYNIQLGKIERELNKKKEEIILKTDFQAELGSMKKGIDEINKDEDLPNLDNSLINRELNNISVEIDNDIKKGIKCAVNPTINDVSDEKIINNDNASNEKTVVNPNPNFYNIFYMSLPMKNLCDDLMRKCNGNKLAFTKELFNWADSNIMYQDGHDLEHYKTAREVYNSKSGICGEMTIFFNACCKYIGIDAFYVHVDVDNIGEKVNHACSLIKVENESFLVDIAYHSYKISHQKWEVVTNEALINNMINWNK